MNAFFQNLTLAKKIVCAIILTTLVATVTVILVVSFSFERGMQSQSLRHLDGVNHLVKLLFEDNRRMVKNYTLLLSADRQIKDNLYYYTELAGERIHPLNAIRHLVKTFDLQFIELGDSHGRVVANEMRPDQHDKDKSQDILIQSALTGLEVSGIEHYGDGFLLKAVVPIYHDESQLIGTISTGIVMNNDFAQIIKNLSKVEILIIDTEAKIVASTFDEMLLLTSLPFITDTFELGAKKFQVMQLPFDDSAGKPLGSVLIMAEDSMSPVLRAANMNIIFALIAVSILSIVTTIFILRRVLIPVNKLRDGAQKIGSGQFDHRITVTSTDELGNLAAVFNSMAANLQQMREVEEKLKHSERLASIGEFTAATAHEINNPIANIIGLLKVMRREIPENEPITEDIELVIKEANRCGTIVRDLLMYSRSSQPRMEKTDLRKLIEESISGISSRHLKGKSISVTFRKPAHEMSAWVDPDQFEQVLRNILLNALQAIKDEGEVVIEILSDSAKNIKIVISDTGCGIREEDLGKIFYPFFTTKKSNEGTGLGLAVCYTIIQSHNGDIDIKSETDRGSVVTLTLPFGEDNG